MRRLFALISMVLVVTLLLSSCAFGGVKIKDYEKKVDQEEFVEKLKEALGLDGEEPFKESWTVKLKETSTYESVQEYKSGETVKESEKSTAEGVLKYNHKSDLGYMGTKSSDKEKGEGYSYADKSRSKGFYTQGTGRIYAFDAIDKECYEYETEEGVYDMMYEMLEESILHTFLDYMYADAEKFDKLEFYIDDNVYTIVVENEVENEEEGTTTTTKAVVQIVVDEDEISFVEEKTRETKTETQNYTNTRISESKKSAVVKLGKAYVRMPDMDDYEKVKIPSDLEWD